MLRIIALLLLTIPIWFEVMGQVKGRVLDDQGEPLPGSNVYLSTDWTIGTVTNDQGLFVVDRMPSTEDSLVISFVGFQEKTVPAAGFQVIQLDLVSLDEEVIVEDSPLIAEEFKLIRISKLDIYTNPAAKADPLLVVSTLPSSTTVDESANISLRGSPSMETGVFLNNVPVYDGVRYPQIGGIGTFSVFNTDILKSVDVYPGNPPLEYGNTGSGVVALHTSETIPEQNASAISITLATLGFLSRRRINKNQSITLFSGWSPSHALKKLNAESLKDLKNFHTIDLGAYWYGRDRSLSWKVFNYGMIEGYQYRFISPSYSGLFEQKRRRYFLTSSIQKDISNGDISLNTGYNISSSGYKYSNAPFSIEKLDLFAGLNYQKITEKTNWKLGISTDYRQAGAFGDFHLYPYALNENHPTIEVEKVNRVWTIEGYAYQKYFVGSSWVLGLGLRRKIHGNVKDSQTSAQFNLNYSKGKWAWVFGVGKYHKNGLREGDGTRFHVKSGQISSDFKFTSLKTQFILSSFFKNSAIDHGSYRAFGKEIFIKHRFSKGLLVTSSFNWINVSGDNDIASKRIRYFLRGSLSYKFEEYWTLDLIGFLREGSMFINQNADGFDNDLGVFVPSDGTEERHRDYANIGVTMSRIIPLEREQTIIAFISVNNLPNIKNVNTYQYNFDYSVRTPKLFSGRIIFFGAILEL